MQELDGKVSKVEALVKQHSKELRVMDEKLDLVLGLLGSLRDGGGGGGGSQTEGGGGGGRKGKSAFVGLGEGSEGMRADVVVVQMGQQEGAKTHALHTRSTQLHSLPPPSPPPPLHASPPRNAETVELLQVFCVPHSLPPSLIPSIPPPPSVKSFPSLPSLLLIFPFSL